MNAAQEAAVAIYMGKGLSKAAAAGIVAVLCVESDLNPLAANNSGTETGGVLNAKGSFGAAQWNGPRQQALASFAQKKGMSVGDLGTQLLFVLTECANSYPKTWAAIQSHDIAVDQMVTAMVEDYERPKDPAAEIARAMAYANDFMAQTIALPSPAPVPTPSAPPRQYTVVAQITAAVMDILSQNGVSLS